MAITYNESGVTYNSTLYTYNGDALGEIFTRSIQDSLGLTDETSHIRAIISFISDSVGLTDSIDKSSSISISISDSEGITDNLDSKKYILVQISDSLGMTDGLEKVLQSTGKTVAKFLELDDPKPIIQKVLHNGSNISIIITSKPKIKKVGEI